MLCHIGTTFDTLTTTPEREVVNPVFKTSQAPPEKQKERSEQIPPEIDTEGLPRFATPRVVPALLWVNKKFVQESWLVRIPAPRADPEVGIPLMVEVPKARKAA